jgi:phosphinothricin acetyltransferase
VGYKLGKWKTVGWWLLVINEYSDEPVAPIKLMDLDPSAYAHLLK